jgi:DNA-directed RNA polymerase
MMMHKEIQLEELALKDGRERYLKKLETSTSRKVPLDRSDLQWLLKQALPLVSGQLKASLSAPQKGRHKQAIQVLQHLDPDLIALVSLSAACRVIAQQKPLASVCYNIGCAIDDELWAAKLFKADAKFTKRISDRARRKHGNISYRRKAVKATAKAEGYETSVLEKETKVRVGGFCVDALLRAIPEVFENHTVKTATKAQNFLRFTSAASQAIADTQEVQSWMHPAYKPMVTPPKPWVDFHTGCYHNTKVARSVTLVRTSDRRHVGLIKKALREGTMSYLLESLNAIQNTRFAINPLVHDLVEWCYEENKALSSFPPRQHLVTPSRPADYDQLSDEQKKGWRITAAQIAERNHGIDGERLTMLQDLATARELRTASEFYIPHNLDFRGRVYPVPHFNHQRADHVKAMIRFAEGRVLSASGTYWLAVHLANTGDFDKISKAPFDARAQWVADNEDMIFKVAQDPMETFDIWSKADKPFSFVAACVEWYGYRCNPESFKSHLAVSLDGSNSGLQHYSCMMRSEREGALVNLTPSEHPADLYQTVADRVKEIVEADAANGSEVAQVVLRNGVTRKLCKRATMTFAYSSQEYGFREQLMEDFMRPAQVEVLQGKLTEHPWAMVRTDKEGNTKLDGGWTAASYLAKLIWRAVNEIVTDACTGMAFFRRCAQLLAHEGKGLVWYTPIGLPVLHLYSEYKVKKVQLFLHDREVRLFTQTEPTTVVNKAKAADAVSPNVVHSMDSAALMLCVLDCVEAGVKDFLLIHDSFGAHPNDTETMYVAVRQSLISMYENYCPFEEIRSQTYGALDAKEKVPATPAKGNLDLQAIMQSAYAFA